MLRWIKSYPFWCGWWNACDPPCVFTQAPGALHCTRGICRNAYGSSARSNLLHFFLRGSNLLHLCRHTRRWMKSNKWHLNSCLVCKNQNIKWDRWAPKIRANKLIHCIFLSFFWKKLTVFSALKKELCLHLTTETLTSGFATTSRWSYICFKKHVSLHYLSKHDW